MTLIYTFQINVIGLVIIILIRLIGLKYIYKYKLLLHSLMEVLDLQSDRILIQPKNFENSHLSLFIFIDCIVSIPLEAHYLTHCSHDATLLNGAYWVVHGFIGMKVNFVG